MTTDEGTRKLRNGELQVVVCTDAASEGLNLQAAAALVNYDLPWNPSKVEQRIGRIDRIGQVQPEIRIVNMLLKNSVDDQVYRSLRERCGMFEHFVGRMQPVLSYAKKLLLGQSSDLGSLESAINSADADRLSRETYLEAEAIPTEAPAQRLTQRDLLAAVDLLRGVKGANVSSVKDLAACSVALPGLKKVRLGLDLRALEHDPSLVPLNPSDETIRRIADTLAKAQEGLPLVISSVERGPFRASVALWVVDGSLIPVESAEKLLALVAEWDGTRLDSTTRHAVLQTASSSAEARVATMEAALEERSKFLRDRQIASAKYRLSLALARTLAAQTESADLTKIQRRMHDLMSRQGSAGQTLLRAYERLGTYPTVPMHHRASVLGYIEKLTKAKKDGAASLAMVSAALDDPRWKIVKS
jgi:hypothetical protein